MLGQRGWGSGGVERESYRGSSLFLCAGASSRVCALTRRFLFLPLTHGVGVPHNHFVHPGEGLGEEHRSLEEAQVASVQRQGKDHVRLFG